jgi:hypothetical protein
MNEKTIDQIEDDLSDEALRLARRSRVRGHLSAQWAAT